MLCTVRVRHSSLSSNEGTMTHVLADMLCLHLNVCDRKNKDKGSRLVRGCWCNESKETCPLHVLGPVLDDCTHGAMMFPAITPASALGVLQDLLTKLGVANADAYRTHDFRRGHAQDLVESGR